MAAADFPYVVVEYDRAGTPWPFSAHKDPFTAGRTSDWLADRVGRWGHVRVEMDGRGDEHFSEDGEGERYLAGLSDADLRDFVARWGGGTMRSTARTANGRDLERHERQGTPMNREELLDEFYLRCYHAEQAWAR